MSPSQKTMPGKVDTSKIVLSRGLAIVLKKSIPVCNDARSNSRKKKGRQRKEPVEDQRCKGCEEISDYEFGPEVFTDWTKENEECYWNPCLVQCVKSLEFKGFVRPTTLLVGGTDYSLEVVRSAWGRRMLRPPNGYDIVMLGDLDPITMNLVAQTQFAPLPEALCKVVYDLTSEGITASLPVISKRLKTAFPEIMLPTDDILYKTLGTLIRERKLYHTGSGYSVVTPDTFRLLAMSTPIERPMLLTNEEALVRLHGVATDNGTTACTQTKQDTLTAWSSAERIVEPRKSGATLGKLKRCHSLKLLRSRDKEKLSRSNSFKSSGTSPGPNIDFRNDIENVDTAKSNIVKEEEKLSMFSKLFRRGRSEKNRSKSKGTSSSTQFPPRDWADPDYVLFNSRATQTLDRNEDQRIKAHTRSSSLNRNSSKDRHSIHLSSTPATPRIVHRNSNRLQTADIYHYRSSSLTRKASSSPKREYRHTIEENSVPRVSNGYGAPARSQEQVKPRPRYESPFSPFPAREKTKLILTASDKYGTVPNEVPKHHGNVSPYQSTDILKSPPVADKLSSFSTPLEKKIASPGWRRPTFLSTSTPTSTLGSSFKSSPPRIVPRFSPLPRDLSSMPPPKPTTNPQTTTKVITEDFKTTETVTKTFPNASKEVRLGTTVDVEISVNNNISSQNNKKSLLTTDLDSPVKNDLLKIATTWNHTIKSNSTKTSEEVKKSTTGIPKLTATTNITTSLSHGTTKDVRTNKVETTTNTFLKSTPLIKRVTDIDCNNGRDSPSKDTMCSSSPRSTLTADAKSEFFSDSPNTTTEVHLSKDDSGFSSSASTSRPMSVSPC